jgi:hypothetical protein
VPHIRRNPYAIPRNPYVHHSSRTSFACSIALSSAKMFLFAEQRRPITVALVCMRSTTSIRLAVTRMRRMKLIAWVLLAIFVVGLLAASFG